MRPHPQRWHAAAAPATIAGRTRSNHPNIQSALRKCPSQLAIRRHVPDLAGQHGAEAFARDACRVERGKKPVARLVDRLVGELERAPVVAGGKGGIAELHAFHRFVRVLVLRLHEPARLVGADRQDGEAEAAMLFGHRAIVAAAVKAGIAGDSRSCRPASRSRSRPTAPCAGRACRAPTSDAPARHGW